MINQAKVYKAYLAHWLLHNQSNQYLLENIAFGLPILGVKVLKRVTTAMLFF